MSVHREAGAGYLTRTKDLIPDADRTRAAGREQVYRPRQRGLTMCLRSKQRFHLDERGFASGPYSWRLTPGTAGYEETSLGRGPVKLRE